jgi:hypothetical protein
MATPRRRRTDTRSPGTGAEALPDVPILTHDDIARRAFELYRDRGGEHGHDFDDWIEAERELRDAVRIVESRWAALRKIAS